MTTRRYPKEEFGRRGDAIYEEKIRPHLKPNDIGKFLAIDIETGEYAISKSEMAACRRLRARIPDAQIWMKRIGYTTTHALGCRLQRETP
jgi:hypothetical protein